MKAREIGVESGAGTAAAAAPGRGHRPGRALGDTGAMQVTFQRCRPLSGRSRVPAQAAGGTCNLGGLRPGPSDTPPPRPGLPGRRALTCTASRSPRGLLGLGYADPTALGAALGVPRGARQEESGGRRRPGRRRRRRRRTPALRSRETHPPPGRSAAAAADHFRGAGEWGGAPAGTSCLRGPNTPRRSGTKALQLLGKASGPVSRRTHGEPPTSRGAVTSQGRAGVPVSRCFRFPKTLRGSWRKKGRGRPPSCFWGLLGSLASVFQRVACIVVCRRLSLWRWISDLSQLEGLGS